MFATKEISINSILSHICLVTLFFNHAESQCVFTKTTGFLNCRNANLSSVPLNIPAETRFIDLSQNNIERLEKSSFNCCSLITELYISSNNISQIHYGVFHNLKKLQILDLSDNKVSTFQVDTPVSLEILYLDRNSLSNENIFQQRLQFLKYLSLVGTNLTKPPIFSSFLPVLQYLDLQDNPSLNITASDLQKLRHLRILYLSPRVFGGRSKGQKCREFVQEARKLKIEVKAFSCHPEEKFEIKSRSFERTYQVDEAMFDRPEDLLLPENENETCLHNLQTQVSNGLKNFVKSLIIERKEMEAINYKIKDTIKLEDYSIRNPAISLYDVHMTGFPVFITKNPILTIASVDAEQLKRFQTAYVTVEPETDMKIYGKFNVNEMFGDFLCTFTKSNYRTLRQMLRRYDFRVWPTNIQERLNFDKMDCFTSLSNQYVDKIIDMVLTSLSKNWLDYASNIANAVVVGPALRNASQYFTDSYRDRVLRDVIGQGITYLKNININSFDVSPALYLKEETSNLDMKGATYNIKIYNLFNYSRYDVNYTTVEERRTTKIFVKTNIVYDAKDAVKLAIAAKSDPSDVMDMFISNMEFDLVLEVKPINKVYKLNIADMKVNVVEKESKNAFFVISIVKKYLGIELANEFKRSMTFLMGQIDFYSLNVN